MSLILGVHLVKKLFLVSDTRATIEYKDGRKEFKDDLIKLFNINRRITALEAGNASPAAFILKKLREEVGEDGSLADIREIINTKLNMIISEYVNNTGHYGYVALIIAGYNPTKTKKIESSALGNAMSAELRAKGDGSSMMQTIDSDIKNSLAKAVMRGGLQKGDLIEIENTIDSGMISVKIDIRNNRFNLEQVDCYKGVVFHPNQSFIEINLPPELVSQVEFGYRKSTNWQDILYEDSEKLISFVNKEIKKHNFKTVGGNIFIGLATPNDYFVFPTGDMATVRNGKIVMTGSVFVDKTGNISYRLEDGKTGKYRFIKDLDESELSLLSL